MDTKQTILIRGGQIIDPSQHINFVGNLLIENGLIKKELKNIQLKLLFSVLKES